MTLNLRNILLFGAVALLFVIEGQTVSWNSALSILNVGLISAIVALGVNLQWGYAGLFNIGVVGFFALGGLAPVLISGPAQPEAWAAGGPRIIAAFAVAILAIVLAAITYTRTTGKLRALAMIAILTVGFLGYRMLFDPAAAAIEQVSPSTAGNIGGLGLPVLLAWPVGAVFAAAAAWVIGKTALGLRSDYLAIATLGIGEIIVSVMKNEDWLARGVKNVIGLPRPVPYEVDLQASPDFVARAAAWGVDPVTASSILVKLSYAGLFAVVLLALVWLGELALKSPWGRMMRAIRDNEIAAEAMGKDVTRRHLQIFILGSALCGLAGAMMVTLDGQLTPGTYNPLRYTYVIWLMVIIGGSGNNWGRGSGQPVDLVSLDQGRTLGP